MELKWITLRVNNMVLAKAFYEESLGLPCVRTFSPAPDMQIAFFKAENGMEIELIESVKIPVQRIQGVSMGIETTKYDDLLLKSRQAGILEGEPQLLGGNLECFMITDPDGMGIQVIRK